jgi:Ca-activated chloride channel family protein
MARGRHRTAVVLRQQASEQPDVGPRKRWFFRPWLAGGLVLVLVLGGFSVGYAWTRTHCHGDPVVLSVVTSPDQQDVVRELAYAWEGEGQSIDGHCAAILVRGQESAAVGQSLSPTLSKDASTRVDVWMPDSSAWVTNAAARSGMADLLSGAHPSVASSPVVMALPQPMAAALGWPSKPISWAALALQRVNGHTWSDYGHPKWGPLQIGVGDPRQSTTALNTLLSVVDTDANGKVSETELHNALLLARAATEEGSTAADFLAKLRGLTTADALLAATGPFPATEQQIAAFDSSSPVVPLVAVHPSEGTIYADYPFVTLKASWVDPVRQHIAAGFLDLLRSRTGQRAYGETGFRDAGRGTAQAQDLQTTLGLGTPAEADARRLPDGEAITKTVVFWTALQRRANLLAIIDTSGSMSEAAPDGTGTRMQVLQQASLRATTLLSPESSVGLWKFSTKLDGDRDYQQLVPIGPLGGALPGGTPRAAALDTAIRHDFVPHGATGLYDTMYAGFVYLQNHWQAGKLNLLVLMTDGQNEDDGLTRAQLVANLRKVAQPDRPVQVIAIGFGSDADLSELTEITAAVGGKAYLANTGDDIDNVFLQTLVGRS